MSRGCDMNNDFPRIVTLLRKERGLSQKQAALELGVSQALLSHYEKGIRECGLDFVVKIADYYGVSCDYLLGRTVERSFVSDRSSAAVNEAEADTKDEGSKTNALLAMNKKLISNSMEIIFDVLEQTDNKGISSEVSAYFMVSVYKMLRALYSANSRNPQAMFSVIPEVYVGISNALQSIIESNINCLTSGKNAASHEGISSSEAPALSPDVISKRHPGYAPSLYNLVRDTEEKMKKLL